MAQDVALIEGPRAGTTTAPDPEPDTVVRADAQRRDRREFDLKAGGPGGDPAVIIPTSSGTIELGHEDIFLMLLALDLGVRLWKLWMEARA